MIDMWRGLCSACPVRAIVCGWGGQKPVGYVWWCRELVCVGFMGVGHRKVVFDSPQGLCPSCGVNGEAWLAGRAHHHHRHHPHYQCGRERECV